MTAKLYNSIPTSGSWSPLFCHNDQLTVNDLLYNIIELVYRCRFCSVCLCLSLSLVNCEGSDNTLWSFGRGSMLKSLDPILITIIVMSAVGVLLGAVCGVLFYCACAHTTNRNLSALENYNFELVDGVKLKKEKLSAQKSYTEAWGVAGRTQETFAGRCWRNVFRTLLRRFSRSRLSVILRTCRTRDWPLEGALYRLYSQTMIVYLFVHFVAGNETKTKLCILSHSWISFSTNPFFRAVHTTGFFSVYCARLCLEMCLFSC